VRLRKRSLAQIAVDPEAVSPILAAVFEAGDGEWRGQLRIRRGDQSEREVDIWARRLDSAAGPRAVAAMRDVTERQHAERLREEVVATVSHDLKNPLGAILANTQMLRRWVRRGQPLEPERLERGLAAIESSAGRMNRLIGDLVDGARLQAGEALVLETEPVDLAELARRCVEQYQATTTAHTLRLIHDGDALHGEWDPRRLDGVLANLLTNAVKYSPDGGEIDIRLGREDGERAGWAVLSVRDAGIGIPAAELPEIFDRFRRGSNVGAIAGTGLGLAGVRHIVEQHGGTVMAESEEGRGTVFTVRLPLRTSDVVPPDRGDGMEAERP
jgi:signal transduction histidine kinase